MRITIHPKVAALVKSRTEQANASLDRFEYPKSDAKKFKSSTTDLVNEVLWTALRTGDVSKHYSQ